MNQFRVLTSKPIAYDSPDHIKPYGTANDNFTNQEFLNRLYKLVLQDGGESPVRVMDLGCSGGGMVKNVLDDGHIAIGLEGSDYSRNRQRAEWATIPDNLFTCDISEPFDVQENIDDKWSPAIFDVVTAWEVLEHLKPTTIDTALANIKKHLLPGGWLIGSIPFGEAARGANEFWHQCVRSLGWWEDKFYEHGFRDWEEKTKYFDCHWVRGGRDMPGCFMPVMRLKTE